MVLDTSLLNTQQYKVHTKGKVEQSRESSSALPYTLVLQLLKREPSGHPQLHLPTLLIYIYIYIYINIYIYTHYSHSINKESFLKQMNSFFQNFFLWMQFITLQCLELIFSKIYFNFAIIFLLGLFKMVVNQSNRGQA